MWLRTPKTIKNPLIEQALEPVEGAFLEQSADEWQHRSGKIPSKGALHSMPVVAIGQPEAWTLQEFYAPGKLPRSLRIKLQQANFSIVRLSCSFRPVHNESRIEWARFRVTLLPDVTTGSQPHAFDLYPEQVLKEKKHQVKVTLNPSLKFQEIETSLGSAEFGFEYAELCPLISATIGNSSDPSWDYRSGLGQHVQGVKWMYLLVKTPKNMTGVKGVLEVEADLFVQGMRLPVALWSKQEQATAQRTVSLW